MLDAKEDGELDFFVNISKYAEGTTNAAGETIFRPLHFSVPASDILTLLASGVSLAEGQLTQFLTGLGLPAETVDGFRIRLMCNIEGVEGIDGAISSGAEGIGLFRTEFL